ncbi:uncharacterized protein LOC144744178 [Ciona intestinalis]
MSAIIQANKMEMKKMDPEQEKSDNEIWKKEIETTKPDGTVVKETIYYKKKVEPRFNLGYKDVKVSANRFGAGVVGLLCTPFIIAATVVKKLFSIVYDIFSWFYSPH